MNSIVLELQKEAIDSSIKTSDLLRKAMVVARKLNQEEILDWVNSELNGYKDNCEIPDYRNVKGKVRGRIGCTYWQPILFKEQNTEDIYTKRVITSSITKLEDTMCKMQTKDDYYAIDLPSEIQYRLSKEAFQEEGEVKLFINPSYLHDIFNHVRNIILEWTLKLEQNNILGKGLSFSEDEKEKAKTIPNNINNFYGPIKSAQIQQGNETAIQVSRNIDLDTVTDFINALKKEISDLPLSGDSKSELESDIATTEAQLNSPKPKEGVIKECLKSIRTILEGAAGSATAQILLTSTQPFL